MPITIQNSAGGGVTLDSTTTSNETLQLPSGGGTLAPLASPSFTGNVGIGVVPESDWDSRYDALQLNGGSALAAYTSGTVFGTILSTNQRVTANTFVGGNKYIATAPAALYLQDNSGQHQFYTAPSGTADSAISWTTAMTIDNDAQVFVGASQFMVGKGTAIGGYGATFYPTGSANNMVVVYNKDYNGGSVVMFFQTLGTTVGTIESSASATSYNTSSDYRLKTDVQPMTGAADRVKLLKPCNFEWIVDGTRVDGFLAHEAQEVVPEAVTGTKDAMKDEEYEVTPAVLDDEGNETTAAVKGTRSVPDMQGIDQSKLVPLLTATIQELIARIEALENV